MDNLKQAQSDSLEFISTILSVVASILTIFTCALQIVQVSAGLFRSPDEKRSKLILPVSPRVDRRVG